MTNIILSIMIAIVGVFIGWQLLLVKKKLNRIERFCALGDIDGKNIKKVEALVGKATKVVTTNDGYIYRWQIVSIFTQHQISIFCDKDYNCKSVLMDFNK